MEDRSHSGEMSPSRMTCSTVTIQIQDEGPGIAPEDLPHLFEMFFRKKDGQDYRIGRGLGLHFCRLVVDAHGGQIRAAKSSRRRRGLYGRVAGQAGAGMPITIVIAEDQRLFRQSLRMLLEHERDLVVVGEAMDGRQAFDLAVERKPSIVLMDVDMPRLDGITATRLIRSCVPDSKVLMLSVHDDDARIVAAVQAGACGYILKDADHQEFLRIIRGTVQGRAGAVGLYARRLCQEGGGPGQ